MTSLSQVNGFCRWWLVCCYQLWSCLISIIIFSILCMLCRSMSIRCLSKTKEGKVVSKLLKFYRRRTFFSLSFIPNRINEKCSSLKEAAWTKNLTRFEKILGLGEWYGVASTSLFATQKVHGSSPAQGKKLNKFLHRSSLIIWFLELNL